MSEKKQQFTDFLSKLKNQVKTTSAGVFIAERLSALLNNRGVVFVTQKEVKAIDFAVIELQKAHDAIASARASLLYIKDVNLVPLTEAQTLTAEYKAVLVEVVEKAYARRRDAVIGVQA
jgi:hypothetical protein